MRTLRRMPTMEKPYEGVTTMGHLTERYFKTHGAEQFLSVQKTSSSVT